MSTINLERHFSPTSRHHHHHEEYRSSTESNAKKYSSSSSSTTRRVHLTNENKTTNRKQSIDQKYLEYHQMCINIYIYIILSFQLCFFFFLLKQIYIQLFSFSLSRDFRSRCFNLFFRRKSELRTTILFDESPCFFLSFFSDFYNLQALRLQNFFSSHVSITYLPIMISCLFITDKNQ